MSIISKIMAALNPQTVAKAQRLPEVVNEQIGSEYMSKQRRKRGLGSTLLSGSSMFPDPQNIGKKTLLGS